MTSRWQKVLLALGLAHGGVASGAADSVSSPPYAPYATDAANSIYNLLFFDAIAPAQPAGERVDWIDVLTATPPDIGALKALAGDATQEGRTRFAAYQRLRAAGESVPRGVLLGVIVEVPLEGGLDSLAAYADGSVRYVNQSGAMLFADSDPALASLARRLLEAAGPVVAAIGPSDQPRRPPPTGRTVRMTFLVSDGLYFGEGPFEALQEDALAAPVIASATALLVAVVEKQGEAKPIP